MKALVVHPEAQVEIDEAATWYEQKQSGVGSRFREEIDLAFVTIQQSPQMWPRYQSSRFQVYLLKRFPYVIYFRDRPDAIWIWAVSHGKRRPGYWRHRK